MSALLVPGEQIGPYLVKRRLGSGGMGTVYLCVPVESCPVPAGREVAVKVLRSAGAGEDRRRFEREARYLQSLRHPGIIRLLDTGEHQGHPYLVMPFVDGRPLDALVADGTGIDQRTAAGLAVQALEALHVAHLAGILHRDLKPGNLMVDDHGRVRLLDFGLAAGPMGESRLTASGDVLGTPVYMSPEQAAGMRDHLGPRTDIYSLGVCLYELLTGCTPFDADNPMAVLRRIIDDPLEPPSRLRRDLARDLETVVLVAMAKDPRDRYRTAEDMAADLRRFLAGRRVRARRPGRPRLLWRAAKRHRRAIAIAALLLFVVGTGSAIIVRRVLAAQPVALPDPRTWVAEDVGPIAALPFKPAPALGRTLHYAALPSVAGAVRAAAVLEIDPAAPPGVVTELVVNDPDIGRGYRLRIELGGAADGGQGGDRLLLQRHERLLASRDVAVPRGRPVRLELQQDAGDLEAALVQLAPDGGELLADLRFLDLAPTDGPASDGTYLALQPGMVTVQEVTVERRRGGEFVSALALADDRRMEGNYARAAALYEDFLAKHPDSPQARQARLRLAVCQAAMPATIEQAYAGFNACAADQGADPAYVMVATFQAWTLALRLNRYEDAEGLFDRIRTAYDLPTLAAAVPQHTLRQLRDDYLARAGRLEDEDPERAVRLYLSFAEIATYLRDPRRGQGLTAAGDLLMGQGSYQLALDTYRRLVGDPRLPEQARQLGRIKEAAALRMLGRTYEAQEAYYHLMDDPALPATLRRWARLWLGDLCCEMDRADRARELWREGSGNQDLPAQIMGRLVRLDGSIPACKNAAEQNDIDYFNGRQAWLRGDLAAARGWFQRVASGSRPNDWPAPLARALAEDAKTP